MLQKKSRYYPSVIIITHQVLVSCGSRYGEIPHSSDRGCAAAQARKMEILTSFFLYVIRLGVSYNVLKSFSQYSNFQMFSNDILRARIDTKSVTEKMVTNLNLNLKFSFNVTFRSWAFRNCAYFVMKPSG